MHGCSECSITQYGIWTTIWIFTTDDVTILDVPLRRVAIMEHRGDARRRHPEAHRVAHGRWPAPKQVRHSMSVVTSGVVRRLPIIASTFVSGPTNSSRRTASTSQLARPLADAARCYALSVTPTIWSYPRSTFIAIGFRPAVRKYATSRSAKLFLPLKSPRV